MPTENQSTFFASTEIVGAYLLPKLDDSEMLDFLVTPMDFIKDHCEVKIPAEFSIKVVVNTEHYVTLALPYYSEIEKNNSQKLDDNELQIISGGHLPRHLSETFSKIESGEIQIPTMANLGSNVINNQQNNNNNNNGK